MPEEDHRVFCCGDYYRYPAEEVYPRTVARHVGAQLLLTGRVAWHRGGMVMVRPRRRAGRAVQRTSVDPPRERALRVSG